MASSASVVSTSLILPRGEILFEGNAVWRCPMRVTSVAAVIVGAGGTAPGSQGWGVDTGGGGGAFIYCNAIQVIPGTDYQIEFGSGIVRAFELTAYNGQPGGNGGQSGSGAGGGYVNGSGGKLSIVGRLGGGGSTTNGSSGGGPGSWSGNGAYGGGVGVGLFGATSTGDYGRGARGAPSGQGTGQPGPGAVRIMWGTGRSFPDLASLHV